MRALVHSPTRRIAPPVIRSHESAAAVLPGSLVLVSPEARDPTGGHLFRQFLFRPGRAVVRQPLPQRVFRRRPPSLLGLGLLERVDAASIARARRSRTATEMACSAGWPLTAGDSAEGAVRPSGHGGRGGARQRAGAHHPPVPGARQPADGGQRRGIPGTHRVRPHAPPAVSPSRDLGGTRRVHGVRLCDLPRSPTAWSEG